MMKNKLPYTESIGSFIGTNNLIKVLNNFMSIERIIAWGKVIEERLDKLENPNNEKNGESTKDQPMGGGKKLRDMDSGFENKTDDIECEEFYELMQTYRHMPIGMQKETKEAYDDVKKYIAGLISEAEKQARREAIAETTGNEFMDHANEIDPSCKLCRDHLNKLEQLKSELEQDEK